MDVYRENHPKNCWWNRRVSIYLSFCLSIYLSFCLSIYLSVYLITSLWIQTGMGFKSSQKLGFPKVKPLVLARCGLVLRSILGFKGGTPNALRPTCAKSLGGLWWTLALPPGTLKIESKVNHENPYWFAKNNMNIHVSIFSLGDDHKLAQGPKVVPR
jgi:hypothetical protein